MRLPRVPVLLAAAALAASPALAQETPPPAQPERAERRGLEGEAIGYLAVPVLLVVVLLIGIVLGVDSDPIDDKPTSP